MSFLDYKSPEQSPDIQRKPENPFSTVPALGPELKLIQWNVWHGSPVEPVLENIAGAEIITLQEAAFKRPRYQKDNGLLSAIQKETDFKHFAYTRSHALIPRSGKWAGRLTVLDAVLIGSKYPIVSERDAVLSEDEAYDLDHDGERRVPYLEAKIRTREDGPLLTIATTHRTIPLLQNINNGVLKRETWRMNNKLAETEDNLALTGDFNAPWFMKHILRTNQKLGRVDGGLARKTLRPGKFKGIPLPQMRVDYLFVTPDIRVTETMVLNPENNPSDHNILSATIQQTT